MTIGAAQTLLRGHGVCPGQRILIAGNGPLNAQVAVELSKAGADVVSVLELAPVHSPRAVKPIMRMLASEPGLTTAGIRGLAQLRLVGVTLRSGCGIAAVESTANGLRATFGQASSDGIQAQESIAVDAVCLGYGFLPNNELLRMLGCRHRYDAGRMQLIAERRDDCQTSMDGVFAIGDCCGLGGAVTAMHEGTIAATSVARSLGLDITSVADREVQRAKRRLARHSAFQTALWSLYAAPRFDTELATADTPICRCENVTLQQLDDALAEGLLSLAKIKRQTRLGMGSCQGRNCATIALSRLAGKTALTPDEYAFFAARAPLKPVSIGELVGPAAD
jgi:NADPH-dependent 2,4-dienoyl-CoA reductase/sulfur reductase-like enzyme